MCLILFAWKAHRDYPLLVAANRDEFYQRPTRQSHVWTDTDPEVLAGKDLQAGGTWMGVTGAGRFAAVTNYREVPATDSEYSRGELVMEYLQSRLSATEYAQKKQHAFDAYAGFNLLIGDNKTLIHLSNRHNSPTIITPGVHGLSNASLNSDWPKTSRGRAQLKQLAQQSIAHDELQSLLTDTRVAEDHELPETGVPLSVERALSATKIELPEYGTRSSTSLLMTADGHIDWLETVHATGGKEGDVRRYTSAAGGYHFSQL